MSRKNSAQFFRCPQNLLPGGKGDILSHIGVAPAKAGDIAFPFSRQRFSPGH